ncbi:MAG: putative iron-sulfur cluster-binding metallochaperone [Thermoflexales bacterium]
MQVDFEERSPNPPNCPRCLQRGRTVPRETVQALVNISLRHVRSSYYFCATASCPVVYFSSVDNSTFDTSQVRERVYQKASTQDDTLVCYCFQHTVAEIRDATPAQREAIMRDIEQGIRTHQCACRVRNPQGTCCLANVRQLAAQSTR